MDQFSMSPDIFDADVKRFPRTDEIGWAVDPKAVRDCITPKTRLIVITNLHNPTSALTPDSVLREIGDIARSIGALVLVDEVYLDAVYERHAANIIPSRARIRGDQQPDEGLRRQRTAMWLDPGAPGARVEDAQAE